MDRVRLQELIHSFDDLERAIKRARLRFEHQGIERRDLIARVDSYEEILVKQRALAVMLAGHLQLRNWPEVTRHLKLISGLSALIRDDAVEVLSELGTSADFAAVLNRAAAELN